MCIGGSLWRQYVPVQLSLAQLSTVVPFFAPKAEGEVVFVGEKQAPV